MAIIKSSIVSSMVAIKQLIKDCYLGLRQDYCQRFMHHCLICFSIKTADLA
jgi:hypothetical protein